MYVETWAEVRKFDMRRLLGCCIQYRNTVRYLWYYTVQYLYKYNTACVSYASHKKFSTCGTCTATNMPLIKSWMPLVLALVRNVSINLLQGKYLSILIYQLFRSRPTAWHSSVSFFHRDSESIESNRLFVFRTLVAVACWPFTNVVSFFKVPYSTILFPVKVPYYVR